ncbi:PIG-L family deacetylase [Streptomyces sp. NPDC051219]|uniref:PIG-L family deacetylase n=1 Tax=Streptomyces sp. NPDC051219 TaxID=3155283 RepID=UPI0034241994
MSRRLLLASAAAVAGLTATGCTAPAPRYAGPTADPAPGKPIALSRTALLMQILAHPDDDLYFMNPDTQRCLDAGVPLVCVYVTAGEADGVNRIPGEPRPAADRTAYSSARHQGLRQAYATMLGLPPFTAWRKTVVTLRGGLRAETNTLANGRRVVELVFLNLAMHTPQGRMGLPALWKARGLSLRTVVADDSPLRETGSYDHDDLTGALAGLMDRHRPTVIQTLDPDPDLQHSDDATRRRDSEQPGYSDHADHTAVALFAWKSMARWVAESTERGDDVPPFVATAYRGYYNRHWPKNLPERVLLEKAGHLVPYGGHPDWDCGNAASCGDYNVGQGRPLTNHKGWVRSTHYRHPGPRTAVATEPDGRLVAYGVLGLRAVRWRETAPGSGEWAAPDDLGGGPLGPVLGAATLKDGRQLLFALRFASLGGRGGPGRREIVLLEQRAPGGHFSAWTGLGNPERQKDRGRRIGSPVAVAASDGRVHLFVRNADKGISTRVRAADGGWGAWQDLGGDEIQDGFAAVADRAGAVHVFASGLDTVHHWVDGVLRQEPALRSPGDSPTAVPVPGGAGVDVVYRKPATNRATTVRIGGAAGPAAGPVLLGKDDLGHVQLRLAGKVLSRTTGPVALTGAVLHHGPQGPLVVGLGPDAAPWLWRP